MYDERVTINFVKPKNAGGLHGANAGCNIKNDASGEVVKLYFKVDDETKVVEDARFKVFGCPVTIASANVACELVKDKTLEEVLQIKDFDIIGALGKLPLNKIHCAIFVEEAIKATVENYYSRLDKESKKKEDNSDIK